MTSIKTIQCEDVPALLAQHDTLILDCRDLGDYRNGHMDGAMHSHDDLVEGLIRRGDKSRTMLIYCYSDHRSEHLTEFFTGFGFGSVYNLAGGYNRWQQQGQESGHG
ncbi:MAG: sulfurtransferase [Oceanospirillaceae bacterium]|nr:sulfurtransferase [Oceanospirillaceae bacterium]|tara:strand:- start:1591 stop:1911 length:321 start_codon:yes stop_codon:yes gene_type:complete